MPNQFDQDDFEAFLQKQVKNQRMYPSDTVWRNITKEIHGDKKWPALYFAAFLLLIATVGVSVYFSPKPNIFASEKVENTAAKDNATQIDGAENLSSKAPYFSSNNRKSVLPVPSVDNFTTSETLKEQNLIAQNSTSTKDENFETQNLNISAINNSGKIPENNSIKIIHQENTFKQNIIVEKAAGIAIISVTENEKYLLKVDGKDLVKSNTAEKEVIPDPSDKNIADKFLKEHSDDLALFTVTKQSSLKNKLSYQIYVAPSASFRKLTEDPALAYINGHIGSGPLAVNYVADVNKIVRHSPGVGIEVGANILYNVTDKFRVKTGLQFNTRQYNIEAYKGNAELSSIALIHNSIVDSITSIAVYRTSNGYSSTELVNRYFQISIPIGFEYQVFGNDFIQLNVAAAVQPTYMLNRNSYLLSTNFKNYTENTNMIRHWNVNSNIEAFITIKSGDYKWQFGPQFRYQHMPTSISAYPIKEHLMDYGLKLGFSKVIK